MATIHLPIRLLAEITTRSGDIDSSRSDPDSMAEGARAHKLVQKRLAKQYEDVKNEVTLKKTLEYGGYSIELQGRADCIIKDSGEVTVCEIKTTMYDIEELDVNDKSFWAQAECYAYIYAAQNGLEELKVRLLLYCIEEDETREAEKHFSFEDLQRDVFALLERYTVWLDWNADWMRLRDSSLDILPFPYENYRKGQRELAVACYKAISGERRLYIQAPTGIGKTMSALFPAVKALGKGGCDKIFYLTAKVVARKAAADALKKLEEAGGRLKSVTLTAKNTICFMDKPNCKPELCRYAKGHFDRVDGAIRDILDNEDHCSQEKIEEYAQKHCVCPFEFELDVSLYCDAVICDYNYLFDPRVALKRFFASDAVGRWAFLIDEAHNLPDRARDMYSAELEKAKFLAVKKLIKDRTGAKGVIKQLNAVNKEFLKLGKMINAEDEEELTLFSVKEDAEPMDGIMMGEGWIKSDSDRIFDGLYTAVEELIKSCDRFFRKKHSATQQSGDDELLELYFECVFFLKIKELYSESYTALAEEKQSITAKLFCADPREFIAEALDKGVGTVAFSATLTPLEYFKNMLGGRDCDGAANAPSPFDTEKFRLLVANRVSTKYKDRESSCSEVAELIFAAASAHKGNYMVFFPSYAYMSEVAERFEELYPEISLLRQRGDMTQEERVEFLERFSDDNSETLVGFCVLGGAFGEGIDLKGERLIGVIVVGVGLPQIDLRQNIIREHYEPKGFEFAYMYPGMNKVFQAIGRVIRTEEDRGIALLIDSRFSRPDYHELFPPHWQNLRYVSSGEETSAILKDFWNDQRQI